MGTVRIVTRMVIDMLLPQRGSIAQFDTLTSDDVARHARDTLRVPETDALAPFSYRTPLIRSAIHAVKFYRHERAAQLLGEAMAGFIAEELAEHRIYGAFVDPLVIPIPLHSSRLKDRGFNQAERIAEVLAEYVADAPLLVERHTLVRIRKTPSQTKLSRGERLQNMGGAFAVTDTSRVVRRDIILVDDVVTTGATLQAASNALIEAGANDVLCIAVAH